MDRKAERLNRCPDAQALLPAYVEGELSENDRSRLEGHLNICSACRKEEAEFRRALGVLKNVPRQESPGDLYYGFVAKLEASEKRSRRLARRLRYAGAAVCLLLVAGVSASPLIRLLTHGVQTSAAHQEAIRNAAGHPSDGPVKMANVTVPTEPVRTPKTANKAAGQKSEPARSVNASPDQPLSPKETALSPKPNSKPKHAEDTDFWHVQPEQGPSAADAIARASERAAALKSSVDIGGERTPKDRLWRKETASIAPYTPDRYERVEVGGMETTIKTGYKLDEDGRKKSIHIEIGTTQEK